MLGTAGLDLAPGVPAAKILPPAPSDGLVPRERLCALLEDAVSSASVTVLVAHAGAGKTQLLAHWARTSPVATAWVTLDAGDDRPGRPWTAVAEAVRRAAPEFSGDDDDLLAVLEALPDELRLVLDDVEELTDPEVRDELRALVRWAPAGLRLVLAGRTAPSLARARLEGAVVDVPGAELAFTPDEAASLVARCGASMTPAQVATAQAMTGGWAAGLRLAARVVHRGGDVDALLAGLPAERSVTAYLEDDVLGGLAATDRTFLQELSVCSRVTPSLAVALTGREDAAAVLARLGRDTALLRAGEGGTEMPPLLRAALDEGLARRSPARRAELRARAAAWCAAHDDPVGALEHARAAGDPALVARLLGDAALPLLLAGEHAALRRACAAIEPEVLDADAVLRLVLPAVDADDADDVSLLGPAATPRALRAALALAAAGDADLRTWRLASEALAAAVAGTRRLARSGGAGALAAAARRARDAGYHHLARQCAALLAGAAARAGDAAGTVTYGAGAVGGDRSAWSDVGHAALALGSLLAAHPEDARRHATEALAGPAPAPDRSLLLHVVRGAAEADEGHDARGLDEMARARAACADRDLPPALAARAALLEHETALRLGRPALARAVRRWLEARVGPTGEVVLMAAREGQPWIGRLPAATLCPDVAVEALLLAADEAHRAHDAARTRRLLVEALDRAAPRDLVRPFAHAPRGLRELLAHQAGSFGATDGFARRALAAGRRGRRRGTGALSDRETTILGLLPTLSTTTEIAAALGVSPNTIKTQVGAIYSKLGVTDRRAAVVEAYDAGLLVGPR